MEKSKKIIQDIVLFLIVLLIMTSYILPKELGNLDELWIYNSAKNVADGLLPYKDFNLVTTPFLPIFVGEILKVTVNELIVMRGLAIILSTAIVFMIAKVMRKLKISSYLISVALIGFVLLAKEHFCIDYNFINLLLILTILYLEIKRLEKNNYKIQASFYYDFVIGILAGLTVGFKQTTGLAVLLVAIFGEMLGVRGKQNWKEYGKILVTRLLGSLIPIGILAIYLSIHQLWKDCIDYCVFGVKEFSNHIPYISLLVSKKWETRILAIMLPMTLLWLYTQTVVKDDKTEDQKRIFPLFCYGVASCIVIFPISDEIHFLIGALPTFIGMVFGIDLFLQWISKKIKQDKIKIFVKDFLICASAITVVLLSLQSIKNLWEYATKIQEQKTFSHYAYIPISEGIYDRIEMVDNYIKEQEEKVYILDASAVIFKIPLNQYDKYYDLFLKGNLGTNGVQKLIHEIANLENVKILIQRPPRNWQTPEEVIEFVENSYPQVEEMEIFHVYQK